MIWVFITSASIIVLFTIYKLWEEKRQKVTRLSLFLISQDHKVEAFRIDLFSFWKFFEQILKFFFLVKIPFFTHKVLKKIITSLSALFLKIKNYIRGKYMSRRWSKTSSNYLKGIAKVKKSLSKNIEKNSFEK